MFFNNVIWPDFSRIPTPESPFISFREIGAGQTIQLLDKYVEVLPAVHTVPAAGFANYSRDRMLGLHGRHRTQSRVLETVNQLNVAMLVIETAFSNREKTWRCSLHLSPNVLADEIDCIARGKQYPIYITHTKPAETELIMTEIQKFDQTQPFGPNVTHDIRRMRAARSSKYEFRGVPDQSLAKTWSKPSWIHEQAAPARGMTLRRSLPSAAPGNGPNPRNRKP